MNTTLWILAFALAAPIARAAECAPAPVKSSQQAVCYATAYAEKNRLPHKGAGVTRRVSKGPKTWTVAYDTKKQDGARGPGWQVEVDIESGTPTRFSSFK
jgi:hypothetical protein